jgi:hypothetical protein
VLQHVSVRRLYGQGETDIPILKELASRDNKEIAFSCPIAGNNDILFVLAAMVLPLLIPHGKG